MSLVFEIFQRYGDSIIEEILIGMSEAKKRYNEIKDKQ